MNSACGSCVGCAGAAHHADPVREREALRVSVALYGTPLLVMMIGLLLVANWYPQASLWLEIVTLLTAAALGYGLGILYLRWLYRLPLARPKQTQRANSHNQLLQDLSL